MARTYVLFLQLSAQYLVHRKQLMNVLLNKWIKILHLDIQRKEVFCINQNAAIEGETFCDLFNNLGLNTKRTFLISD